MSETKKPQHTSVKDCLDRIDKLENFISRLAVMSGQGNLLAEYGLKRWEPGKEHMTKYKGKS